VLGERIGGWVGRLMAGVARRLHPTDGEALRIPFEDVDRIGSDISLRVSERDLADRPLESWLADKVIGRIPGARNAS
jgi:hypothetical protein